MSAKTEGRTFRKRLKQKHQNEDPTCSGGEPSEAVLSSWDKTTFRITQIPTHFNTEMLLQNVVALLRLEDPSDVRIHSLASDATAPVSRTATVSFRRIPALLSTSDGAAEERSFSLGQDDRHIFFDTNFKGFTPLSSIDNDSIHNIDCIVVHGWAGHPFGSFKSCLSSESHYMWLRDSLPIRIPSMRVWLYGYGSKLDDPNCYNDFHDYAEIFRDHLRILRKRTSANCQAESVLRETNGRRSERNNEKLKPIVFIVHSLGGIILMDSIIQMRKENNKYDLMNLESTYGALFFGVPSQGMDVEALLSMTGDLPSRFISDALDRQIGFRSRERLHQEFCRAFHFRDSKIIQFYEKQATHTVIKDIETNKWSRKGPARLLVHPASAACGRAWETGGTYVKPINANHSTLVKFPKNDRDGLERVLEVLTEFAIQAPSKIYSRLHRSSEQERNLRKRRTWSLSSSESSGEIAALEIRQPRRAPIYTIKDVEACIRSLCFETIDNRCQSIKKPHRGTCDWIIQTEQVKKWLAREDLQHNNGILWIKGNPGAGKSTLLKSVMLRHQKANHESATVSFFFHARGSILERTALGMARSLTYQLIENSVQLRQEFIPKYQDKKKKFGERITWTLSELQDFLLDVPKYIGTQSLFLFVDALDECDRSEVRQIVGFLENLSNSAVTSACHLNICLSSRHYPEITMTRMLELNIDKVAKHIDDISKYVSDKLVINDGEIEQRLVKQANGIFMWIILVVEILNKAHDDGDMRSMYTKLKEIPEDLDALFLMLLQENNFHKQETVLMFQWILFSQRLLKPEELYFAVLAGTAPRELGEWDRSKITMDMIRRYIKSRSRGLIEIRKSPETEASVQFIHETVNDFLLRNGRLEELDPALKENVHGLSNGRLETCCAAYLMMEELKSWRGDITGGKNIDERFPFIEYVLDNMLYHADDSLQFLNFVRERSRPDELFGQLPRLEKCFLKAKTLKMRNDIDRYETYWGDDTSLLYVASMLGCKHLASRLLGTGAEAHARGGLYGNALQATIASLHDKLEKTRGLNGIEEEAGVKNQGRDYANTLPAANRSDAIEIIQDLLTAGVDVNAQEGDYVNALQAATIIDDIEIVQVLLEAGADVNAPGGRYGNALQLAAYNDNINSVRALLKAGAEVNAQGGHYGNALQAATFNGNIEIMHILLEAGAEVNAQGGWYGTALLAACYGNKIKVVDALLEVGADASFQGGVFGSALQASAIAGTSTEVLRALLRAGADVNVLKEAHRERVQKLLDKESSDEEIDLEF